MNLQTFTSFEGRIPRKTFWLAILVMIVISWILQFILFAIFGTSMMPDATLTPEEQMAQAENMMGAMMIPLVILMLITLWPSLAIYTKRWHDRNKSGWWSLIMLVPIIGGIWLLVECGFLRGTEGPNNYGPDPIAD
ncbi:MAG: DUF805 domain-containing protein [Phyllobacteriaceae bacterium]|jgi:uncharacterized membrane protein YhaH (DUF805 family)|nr:DUF805 domain-containing protein [Phyllobacteriaceae bacterium]